jgi:hypothetical protein
MLLPRQKQAQQKMIEGEENVISHQHSSPVNAPAKQTISCRGQLTTLLAGEDLRHSQISGKSIPVAGLI